jgi:mycoredoxin
MTSEMPADICSHTVRDTPRAACPASVTVQYFRGLPTSGVSHPELGVTYDYIGLEADATTANKARVISGRTNIHVIVFTDDSHFVEPSQAELREKIASLQAWTPYTACRP